MRPGPLLVPALTLLCLASVAVPIWPPLAWGLAAGLVALVGAALVEAGLLAMVRVQVDRRAHAALALDEPEQVTLGLRTTSRSPIRVVVRQRWPKILSQTSSVVSGTCPPGQVLDVAFDVRGVARGAEELEPAHAALSRWGLAERVVSAGGPTRLTVLPNLKAVGRLHKQLNQAILRGLGNRTAPRLGKGREFDRLREYVVDDDFRDIAWRASARHGHLIVREFRVDRSQDILVCLDRGHRMAPRIGAVTKLDHAVNATALLAYLAKRMEDRIGVLSFGAEVEFGIRQGHGTRHLRQITDFLSDVRAEFMHTDYRALAVHVGRRLRHRALVVILTDLPEAEECEGLVRAVQALTRTHLPLLLVPTDPALEAGARFQPADFPELCRTLVARDIWSARRHLVKDLRRRGAIVVESTPERIGLEAVNAYLEVKRRQLL